MYLLKYHKELLGSGAKIWKLILPYLALSLILNIIYPAFFSIGSSSKLLKNISEIILIPGLIIWIWSGILIIINVPKNKLITNGPYAIAKHPIYNGVAILVFPWLGFIFNSWLGVIAGITLFLATKKFAPEEEKKLAENFGSKWEEYKKKVLIPWL